MPCGGKITFHPLGMAARRIANGSNIEAFFIKIIHRPLNPISRRLPMKPMTVPSLRKQVHG
jgi:hypothetical protein